MMEIKEFEQTDLYLLCEMFNEIEIGILLIKKVPKKAISCNSYFKLMAEGREERLIEHILESVDRNKIGRTRDDIDFPDGSSIGYTIYSSQTGDYIVFLNDISQRKIYFESMGESFFYDRLLGFIAEIVHEIGNPLTSISTTLQVLLGSLSMWDDEKKSELIRRADNEIERLSNYLDRMRDFSSAQEPEKKPHILRQVIERAVAQNSAMLDKKGISVEYHINNAICVNIDEDIFYQVLLNLFLNSVDILSANGKICIAAEDMNDIFVKLVYKNNGPSIPEDLRKKILMPFFSTKKKGRGIGLALSLKQMIHMGGSLKVEEPEGEWGARFALYLPVQ
jgi:signal transduction histidine kinase